MNRKWKNFDQDFSVYVLSSLWPLLVHVLPTFWFKMILIYLGLKFSEKNWNRLKFVNVVFMETNVTKALNWKRAQLWELRTIISLSNSILNKSENLDNHSQGKGKNFTMQKDGNQDIFYKRTQFIILLDSIQHCIRRTTVISLKMKVWYLGTNL